MTRVFIFVILIISASVSQAQTPVRDRKVQDGDVKQLSLASDSRLDAQLQSTLDVRSAKVGDQVVLKTTKAVKQNGETVIQKGSRLYGRVTEVQQRTKANTTSKIGMVFERIEGTNLSAPISASIVAITNVAARTALDDTVNSDISGTSRSSARTTSSSRAGGGLLGGVGSTVGSVLNTTTQTVGSVAGTAANTVGTTDGTLGRTLGGVQISHSTNAAASSSTTLSSPNKNLRLEKGVVFQLNIEGGAPSN